ncbi:MAP microtubule affinity-regulating kinase 1 [Balamuthia mandrillaris]
MAFIKKRLSEKRKLSLSKDAFTTSRGREKQIGNYVLGQTIGEGRYGKVKLAKMKETGQVVAVKIMKKANLEKADLIRIKRELRIMTLLDHPNIVQLYQVIDTPDTTSIVMEYCEGGDLYDFISTYRRLSLPEALRIFRQIVAGLLYCHQHYVIHRDIKPENLLLTPDRQVKIGDFGFSRSFNPHDAMETACGSLTYAAPEVIAGKGYLGPKADVWSLGCVLYVLLTGSLPFDGANDFEVIPKIRKGKFQDSEYLDEGNMRELITCMLNPDPQKRANLEDIQKHPWTWSDKSMLAMLVRPFANAITERRIRAWQVYKGSANFGNMKDRELSSRSLTSDQSITEEAATDIEPSSFLDASRSFTAASASLMTEYGSDDSMIAPAPSSTRTASGEDSKKGSLSKRRRRETSRRSTALVSISDSELNAQSSETLTAKSRQPSTRRRGSSQSGRAGQAVKGKGTLENGETAPQERSNSSKDELGLRDKGKDKVSLQAFVDEDEKVGIVKRGVDNKESEGYDNEEAERHNKPRIDSRDLTRTEEKRRKEKEVDARGREKGGQGRDGTTADSPRDRSKEQSRERAREAPKKHHTRSIPHPGLAARPASRQQRSHSATDRPAKLLLDQIKLDDTRIRSGTVDHDMSDSVGGGAITTATGDGEHIGGSGVTGGMGMADAARSRRGTIVAAEVVETAEGGVVIERIEEEDGTIITRVRSRSYSLPEADIVKENQLQDDDTMPAEELDSNGNSSSNSGSSKSGKKERRSRTSSSKRSGLSTSGGSSKKSSPSSSNKVSPARSPRGIKTSPTRRRRMPDPYRYGRPNRSGSVDYASLREPSGEEAESVVTRLRSSSTAHRTPPAASAAAKYQRDKLSRSSGGHKTKPAAKEKSGDALRQDNRELSVGGVKMRVRSSSKEVKTRILTPRGSAALPPSSPLPPHTDATRSRSYSQDDGIERTRFIVLASREIVERQGSGMLASPSSKLSTSSILAESGLHNVQTNNKRDHR